MQGNKKLKLLFFSCVSFCRLSRAEVLNLLCMELREVWNLGQGIEASREAMLRGGDLRRVLNDSCINLHNRHCIWIQPPKVWTG